ncbi:MAG: peptidoglycan DD-metalloendopeptidase family protein [Candidatus Omnitrophica bacterium]|nr:peptidoglycan DD-metalloendopeptidase family protein [Candidatus Omnitrophota bacterium]
MRKEKGKRQNEDRKDTGYRFRLIPFAFYMLTFFGCATTGPAPLPHLAGIEGFYHRIERAQTLWRISQKYGVSLEELVSLNKIADANRIETGRLIFIPGVKDITEKPEKQEDFIWPLKGEIISTFGQIYENTLNKGVNIRISHGKIVVASRSGRVVFCALNFAGFKKTVIIDHEDGFFTVYALNSEISVKTGDRIDRGGLIAKFNEGCREGRSYLHFEIRKGHIPQNPYFYLS